MELHFSWDRQPLAARPLDTDRIIGGDLARVVGWLDRNPILNRSFDVPALIFREFSEERIWTARLIQHNDTFALFLAKAGVYQSNDVRPHEQVHQLCGCCL